MNKEREVAPKAVVSDISFLLPDGLECHWQFHPSTVSHLVLLKCAQDLASETQRLGQESRLSGYKESIREVSKVIQSEFPDLSINNGKTTFFEQSLAEKGQLLIPDWADISDTYFVSQVFTPTLDESTVIKSFMRDSFHNLNETSIDIAIRNHQNRIYLVTTANAYVGMFVLLEVPALGEIQLHSVAGRGSLASISQQKGKLPILLSGVMHAIDQDLNYIDKTTSSFTPPYQRLTFSSSGAAPLYRNLGFSESDRGGISIKKVEI